MLPQLPSSAKGPGSWNGSTGARSRRGSFRQPAEDDEELAEDAELLLLLRSRGTPGEEEEENEREGSPAIDGALSRRRARCCVACCVA